MNKWYVLLIAFTLLIILAMVFTFMAVVPGSEGLRGILSSGKESLVGLKFKVTEYDTSGNNTMTAYGSRVSIGVLKNFANRDSESLGFKSEVLDITIDGNQLIHVGSTLIIAEDGIDTIQDFDINYMKIVGSGSSKGFMPIDRTINNFMNWVGREKLIVVKTQDGVIVGVYQGDSVYVSIPTHLPKTTELSIDGKRMYIYRANYNILDTALFR